MTDGRFTGVSGIDESHAQEGIGTEMMRQMLLLLKTQGYEKASLSVQKANYAVKMYEKVGFKTIEENDEEYLMVCEL